MNKLNLTNYINWLKDKNRSLNTIRIYTEILKNFSYLENFTTETIRNYLKDNITKYQPNTLKVIRQSLSSYAKFNRLEIEWERINGIIPKMSRAFFSTLTQEELIQLKQAKSERSIKTHHRNNLIFDFLFYSGLRVSELVNIRHCDWNDKRLRVHGKGNKVRFVFLPPFLTNYFNPNLNDYLFTNQKQQPLTQLVIRQIIQQRLKKAGIDKPITPHSFRRSFATLLHNNGAQLTTIQRLLGHDSIQTTQTYIHNDFDYLYDDYSKILKNNPNLNQIINHEIKNLNQY